MEVTSLPQPTSEALTRECLRSGSRGRPFIPINPDQVEFLISVGRSMEEIAQTLLISRRTLYRRCEEFQICKKRERYCQLSDCDLDDIMRHLTSEYPTCGLRMLSGHLLRMGVRVPRQRLRESLLRVDPIHSFVRQLNTVERRTYSVPNANSLFRWFALFHTVENGYTWQNRWSYVPHCLPTAVKCSNNNRAATVGQCFIEATERFGWPFVILH